MIVDWRTDILIEQVESGMAPVWLKKKPVATQALLGKNKDPCLRLIHHVLLLSCVDSPFLNQQDLFLNRIFFFWPFRLVQSLVISRLDYCSLLLTGLPLSATCSLQVIQHSAVTLFSISPSYPHTTTLLQSLHWLTVGARNRFKTLMIVYKARN